MVFQALCHRETPPHRETFHSKTYSFFKVLYYIGAKDMALQAI